MVTLGVDMMLDIRGGIAGDGVEAGLWGTVGEVGAEGPTLLVRDMFPRRESLSEASFSRSSSEEGGEEFAHQTGSWWYGYRWVLVRGGLGKEHFG